MPTSTEQDVVHYARWLFGYGQSNITRPDPPTLPGTGIRDVLIVVLDVDRTQNAQGKNTILHIGLSVLDTRDLHAMVMGSSAVTNPIRSRYFRVSPGHRTPSTRRVDSFAFGPVEVTSPAAFEAILGELSAEHREICLVHHGWGSQEDATLPRHLVNPYRCLPRTMIVDMGRIVASRQGLYATLRKLGIPGEGLGFSGHRAHYLVRALLMMAARDGEGQLSSMAVPPWILTFRTIAQTPRPPTTSELRDPEGTEKRRRMELMIWSRHYYKNYRKAKRATGEGFLIRRVLGDDKSGLR